MCAVITWCVCHSEWSGAMGVVLCRHNVYAVGRLLVCDGKMSDFATWEVRAGVWYLFFFFSSRRRHTRFDCDWSSDVCSSDLAHVVRAGLVATGIVAVLAIRPQIVQPVQPGERGGAPRAATLRASIPVHALVLSQQSRRYLELQYRSFPTEFMGCMIGTVERGVVLVQRIAPADVEPARSTRTRVMPTQSCDAAGWPGTVGVVHSHPEGQDRKSTRL